MGCSHSTLAPTDDDWEYEHGPPAPFLCRELPPSKKGDALYEFSVAKIGWKSKKETSIEVQHMRLKLVPVDENKTVLYASNDEDQPIAVLMIDARDAARRIIQVYSTTPATPHQTATTQHDDLPPLYEWATITKRKDSHQYNMTTTLPLVDNVHYTSEFYGNVLFGKRKLVLQREGLVCASLKRTSQNYDWKCHVGPGVDPTLIVCFVVCTDKLREIEKLTLEAAHHPTSYRTSNVM